MIPQDELTPEQKQIRKIFALIGKLEKEIDIWMYDADTNPSLAKQYQKKLQYVIMKIEGHLDSNSTLSEG